MTFTLRLCLVGTELRTAREWKDGREQLVGVSNLSCHFMREHQQTQYSECPLKSVRAALIKIVTGMLCSEDNVLQSYKLSLKPK